MPFLPICHVVVFSSPAPKEIWESVDLFEMFDFQGRDAAEYVFVG